MRLFLLIPLLTVTLRASPITVVQTQTTNAHGFSDLNYLYDLPPLPGQVTTAIRGDVNCYDCDGPLNVAIDFTMDLYTPGTAREGIGLLQMILDSDGDGSTGVRVNGAIGPYSPPAYPGNCPKGISCYLSGYFAFELGTPFTVHLSGLANNQSFGGGGFSATANIQLFELPPQGGGVVGAPVQILLLPEPSAATLSALGVLALMLFAGIRKRGFIAWALG